jgi:hypothetical protein
MHGVYKQFTLKLENLTRLDRHSVCINSRRNYSESLYTKKTEWVTFKGDCLLKSLYSWTHRLGVRDTIKNARFSYRLYANKTKYRINLLFLLY